VSAPKRPRLGRGLDALLGGPVGDLERPAPAAGDSLRQMPVEQLQRGRYQPRTRMDQDALEELAASIRAQGVVQPIVVRPIAADSYEIVAGERRWRAAQLAGLATVPVVVRDLPDEAAIAVALIENIQRQDLNPVDEAHAFQRLTGEFGLTHQQIAESVGRSRASVTNTLRLLSLNKDVLEALADGRLEMGHGRALLGADGRRQSDLAATVMARGLSVRETEQLVRRALETPAKKAGRRPSDPDVARLEKELSDRLGARVSIRAGKGGHGSLVIEYHSLDELDGILGRIR